MSRWLVLGPEPNFFVGEICEVLRPHLFVGAWQRSIIGGFWSLGQDCVRTRKRYFALFMHLGGGLRAATSHCLRFGRWWEVWIRWRCLLASFCCCFVVPGKSSHPWIRFWRFRFFVLRLDEFDGIHTIKYLIYLLFQMWGFASDFRKVIEVWSQFVFNMIFKFHLFLGLHCYSLAIFRFKVRLRLGILIFVASLVWQGNTWLCD